MCRTTAGCFGFTMQSADEELTRTRCFLYRDDCMVDLAYGQLKQDALYKSRERTCPCGSFRLFTVVSNFGVLERFSGA